MAWSDDEDLALLAWTDDPKLTGRQVAEKMSREFGRRFTRAMCVSEAHRINAATDATEPDCRKRKRAP